MAGIGMIFQWVSALNSPKETAAVFQDPTLYSIRTKTQVYRGNIAFQNDIFMKVALAAENHKVVKILKENIEKVEILNSHPEYAVKRNDTRGSIGHQVA